LSVLPLSKFKRWRNGNDAYVWAKNASAAQIATIDTKEVLDKLDALSNVHFDDIQEEKKQ